MVASHLPVRCALALNHTKEETHLNPLILWNPSVRSDGASSGYPISLSSDAQHQITILAPLRIVFVSVFQLIYVDERLGRTTKNIHSLAQDWNWNHKHG